MTNEPVPVDDVIPLSPGRGPTSSRPAIPTMMPSYAVFTGPQASGSTTPTGLPGSASDVSSASSAPAAANTPGTPATDTTPASASSSPKPSSTSPRGGSSASTNATGASPSARSTNSADPMAQGRLEPKRSAASPAKRGLCRRMAEATGLCPTRRHALILATAALSLLGSLLIMQLASYLTTLTSHETVSEAAPSDSTEISPPPLLTVPPDPASTTPVVDLSSPSIPAELTVPPPPPLPGGSSAVPAAPSVTLTADARGPTERPQGSGRGDGSSLASNLPKPIATLTREPTPSPMPTVVDEPSPLPNLIVPVAGTAEPSAPGIPMPPGSVEAPAPPVIPPPSAPSPNSPALPAPGTLPAPSGTAPSPPALPVSPTATPSALPTPPSIPVAPIPGAGSDPGIAPVAPGGLGEGIPGTKGTPTSDGKPTADAGVLPVPLPPVDLSAVGNNSTPPMADPSKLGTSPLPAAPASLAPPMPVVPSVSGPEATPPTLAMPETVVPTKPVAEEKPASGVEPSPGNPAALPPLPAGALPGANPSVPMPHGSLAGVPSVDGPGSTGPTEPMSLTGPSGNVGNVGSSPTGNTGGIERPARTDYDVGLHEPRAGETYETISEEWYNTKKLAAALRAYNRNKALQGQGPVEVPPIDVLRRMYPQLLGGEMRPATVPAVTPEWAPSASRPEAFNPVRAREYIVPPGGMTMRDVARAALGLESRWVELYELNPEITNPGAVLPAGTRLRLP